LKWRSSATFIADLRWLWPPTRIPVGMLAAVTERRVAARADPAPAAVVALGLALERLEVAAQQLVARQLLEHRALLVGHLREVLRVLQPLEQLVGDRELALDAAEDPREHAVERVEVGLALHEARRARRGRSRRATTVLTHRERAHEHHPLLDRDGDALVAQAVEELEEHRLRLLAELRTEVRPLARQRATALAVARERVGVLLGLEQRADERQVLLDLLLVMPERRSAAIQSISSDVDGFLRSSLCPRSQ
jgi:hypothetical protein